MTDSAFEWSVGKLQELNFDGDADALAAYVNALIENNRDAEGGEPELLRSRARQELEDFLGAPQVLKPNSRSRFASAAGLLTPRTLIVYRIRHMGQRLLRAHQIGQSCHLNHSPGNSLLMS
jgi:hypothetical protein